MARHSKLAAVGEFRRRKRSSGVIELSFTLVCRLEKKVRRGAEYDDMLILLTTIVMAAPKRVPSFDRSLSLSLCFQLARSSLSRASVHAPSLIRTVHACVRRYTDTFDHPLCPFSRIIRRAQKNAGFRRASLSCHDSERLGSSGRDRVHEISPRENLRLERNVSLTPDTLGYGSTRITLEIMKYRRKERETEKREAGTRTRPR